jgi:hypothetical protein
MVLGSHMISDKEMQFMKPKDFSKLGRLNNPKNKRKLFSMLNKVNEEESNFIIKEE